MSNRSQLPAAVAAFFLLLACAWQLETVTCRPDGLLTMTLGGARDIPRGKRNAADIESLALFAVQEHNKKQNAMLQYVRVLKSKEHVVAGTMYHLTLEAIDAGTKKLYEVKVWVKPWINFKQLQEFKPVAAPPCMDLGVKQGNGLGWIDR